MMIVNVNLKTLVLNLVKFYNENNEAFWPYIRRAWARARFVVRHFALPEIEHELYYSNHASEYGKVALLLGAGRSDIATCYISTLHIINSACHKFLSIKQFDFDCSMEVPNIMLSIRLDGHEIYVTIDNKLTVGGNVGFDFIEELCKQLAGNMHKRLIYKLFPNLVDNIHPILVRRQLIALLQSFGAEVISR